MNRNRQRGSREHGMPMAIRAPSLRESLAITYPMTYRSVRLVRTLAELDGQQDVAQRARSLCQTMSDVALAADVAPEPRDGRELMALELRKALDVLAEANPKRLIGHGRLSTADAQTLDARVEQLLSIGEALAAAIRRLPAIYI